MTSWRARRTPARRYGAFLVVLAFLMLVFLVAVACNGETESQATPSPTILRLTATLPLPRLTPTPPSSLEASESCSAGDLEASAFYQGATAMTAGGILVTNIGSATCVVQGRPDLVLMNGEGDILAVVDRGNAINSEAEAVRLRQGEVAVARFAWISRCPLDELSTPVAGGVVFVVNLLQDGGQLSFYATDPISGEPQGHGLPCGVPDEIPVISVGTFERAGN